MSIENTKNQRDRIIFQFRHFARKKMLVLFVILKGSVLCLSQPYPQNYFRYPLDSLPNFVSPFGGLRDNHFHSGVDLKTNEREGLPVYASADGYVSRIKIQSIGYGKAIYLDHPNGYTTVYGHLQRYYGKIAEWIHRYQYKNQSFELDKIFERPLLFVKKGDTLGFSGNSGGSTGPHLHFEIRHTKSEDIINPALFGIVPHDTLKPVIRKIIFYTFVPNGLFIKRELSIAPADIAPAGDTSLSRYKKIIELDPGVYGLGIEAYDYIHNSRDEKALYQYSTKYHPDNLKLRQQFAFAMNRFAFDKSKYINAHIDYPYYKSERTRIQKCFVDDGNEIHLYTTNEGRGRINLSPASTGEISISAADVNQNTRTIILNVRAGLPVVDKEKIAYLNSIKSRKKFFPGKNNTIKLRDFELSLAAGSIYDTIYYEFEVLPGPAKSYSKAYKIHTPNTPLHRSFDIAIKPTAVAKKYQSKLLLAYFDKNEKNYRSAGGAYENGWVIGKGSVFGNYFVTIDSIAPVVEMEPKESDSTRIAIVIRDNFSGIGSYSGYLNGKWILLDFDAKNNLLTYEFDEVWKETVVTMPKLELHIKVEDRKGNITERIFELKGN